MRLCSARKPTNNHAAITAGEPAAVTLTEGMWAVATGAAAHRSIDEARPVELSEVLDPS